MKNIFKKISERKGVVLTEAIVSITLLALAAIILGSIISSAYKMTIFSRNYMIAQGLITEGVEGVINIRDTNWLIDPDNPECWLRKNPEPGETCDPEDGLVMANNSYILIRENDNQWKLQHAPKPLDLENTGPSAQNEHFVLYEQPFGDESIEFVYQSGSNEPSVFYREIRFLDVQDEIASFHVKLQWFEGKKIRTVVRTYIINNYI